MRVEARVYQAALKSYGWEPGPLDGIIGDLTRHAALDFDNYAAHEAGGEIWGDYSIIPAGDNRSVDISPDSVARRFQVRGSAYLAEHPDEVVFPPTRSASRDAVTEESTAPPAPLELSLPFWRSSNPWAWLLSAFGFFGLSGVAFWVGKRMRVRRA